MLMLLPYYFLFFIKVTMALEIFCLFELLSRLGHELCGCCIFHLTDGIYILRCRCWQSGRSGFASLLFSSSLQIVVDIITRFIPITYYMRCFILGHELWSNVPWLDTNGFAPCPIGSLAATDHYRDITIPTFIRHKITLFRLTYAFDAFQAGEDNRCIFLPELSFCSVSEAFAT